LRFLFLLFFFFGSSFFFRVLSAVFAYGLLFLLLFSRKWHSFGAKGEKSLFAYSTNVCVWLICSFLFLKNCVCAGGSCLIFF